MKPKQSGMILLSTLSMIIIITLLVLSRMQQTLLYAKALGQQNDGYQLFYQMELMAQRLIRDHTLLDKGDCIVQEDEANSILVRLEKKGCSIKEGLIQYQFLIEDLGIFDCLVIKQKGEDMASQHRRFSLMRVSQSGDKMYLQLRVITPISSIGTCNKELHVIKPGISGWRFGNL
jgi:hypothetical protein